MTLAGDDQRRVCRPPVKVRQLQHHVDAHLQGTCKKCRRTGPKAACRAAARQVQHVPAHIPLQQRRQLTQSVVQPPHHGRVRALLGAEHGAGSGGAAQRVVNVAHGQNGDTPHRRIHAADINAVNFLQCTAHGDEALSRRTVKLHAHGGSRAAAAVIGGAAAQRQHQPFRPVMGGVADQLAHAIGGGLFRVAVLAHHGQSRRRSHLHHGGAVRQQAVAGGDGFAVWPGAGHRHLLPAYRRQKRVHRSLAAVGHRNGADLRLRLL